MFLIFSLVSISVGYEGVSEGESGGIPEGIGEPKVKVALVHYPPYTIQNETAEHSGMVYDLLKSISNLDVVFMPPKRAMEEYKRANVDLLLFSDVGAYSVFKKSSKFLPLFQGNTYLIYIKTSNNNGVLTKENLSNKAVAVIRGVDSEAKELRLLGLDVIEVENLEQSLKMLALNRIEYSNMSLLPFQFHLKSMQNKSIYDFSKEPTFLLNVGLFYRKNSEGHVISVVNEIAKSYLSDRYYSIINKYITSDQQVMDYLPNQK